MASAPLVKDLMVPNPIVCDMEIIVRKAIDMMESYGIGSLIVVDKFTRKPLNIITHKDIISAIYQGKLDSTVKELIELLEKNVLYTINENEPVIEALRIFDEKGIEHLPVLNDNGDLVGIITGSDILKGLPKFAFIDALTGLESRRVLEYLDSKLKSNPRKNVYVLMIDIDNFKKINDTYGHMFGDRVLKKVAEIILNSVRSHDNVIRYGGEEIVVILHRVSERDAKNIAERIRKRVEAIKFEEHPEVKVSVSIGVAPFEGSIYKSIEKADEAMYTAKRKGKNRVEVYSK